jgi:hypothetical protein
MNKASPREKAPNDHGTEDAHNVAGKLYPVALLAPRPKLKTSGDKVAANYSDF